MAQLPDDQVWPLGTQSYFSTTTNSRKRKAPTLREADWEPVKTRVIELHIQEGLSLPEVKNIIEEEYELIEFRAT